MPYADPDKARKAKRDSARKRRQGGTVAVLAEKVKEAANLPEPPSHEDLIKVLGVEAMNGHVPAIRLLLEEYRRDGNSDSNENSSLAVVHELQRRNAG